MFHVQGMTVQQKPELEKEGGIETVVLACGYYQKFTGCGEHNGEEIQN